RGHPRRGALRTGGRRPRARQALRARRTGGAAVLAVDPRELDVLDLVAAGIPTADIAARLGVSTKTVSNNVSTILGKLGLTDRVQAAVVARDAGPGRSDRTGLP
ncbi:MAG: LuxR C-terminal-related transcriptional regulator, partial [Acidimicrobiales bacterium]|nr:LuxR C-terminal-related transcriptional regulator [Acidimicrobiales bacterium]